MHNIAGPNRGVQTDDPYHSTAPIGARQHRTPPSHGGNAGSNPAGDANEISELAVETERVAKAGAGIGQASEAVGGKAARLISHHRNGGNAPS